MALLSTPLYTPPPAAQDQQRVHASRQPVLHNFNEMADDCTAGLLHLWTAHPRLVLAAAQGGLMRTMADALEAGESWRLMHTSQHAHGVLASITYHSIHFVSWS